MKLLTHTQDSKTKVKQYFSVFPPNARKFELKIKKTGESNENEFYFKYFI